MLYVRAPNHHVSINNVTEQKRPRFTGKENVSNRRKASFVVLVAVVYALFAGCFKSAAPDLNASTNAEQQASAFETLKQKVDAIEVTYHQAITSGKNDIQPVEEFCALFPSTENFISYYTSTQGSASWNAHIGLYGRYVLALQTDIQMNADRTKIVRYGPPQFTFREIDTISPDGRSASYNRRSERKFGVSEWKKLFESKGDFTSIDIHPTTNEPVPHFAEYWKAF